MRLDPIIEATLFMLFSASLVLLFIELSLKLLFRRRVRRRWE